MELIKYLNECFFTKQELLDISKITEQEFVKYQESGVMPKCSYKIILNLKSDSFLGLHSEEQEIEYYAKGYSSWLVTIHSINSTDIIYSAFVKRYKAKIEHLIEQGHSTNNPKLNSDIELHIEEEWRHFLNGTYGLCTKSGLPEDIAAKELATLEINELSDKTELNKEQLNRLSAAVNLLDSASSFFAPHERLKSSRHRLVNEIRRKYKLLS